MIFWTGHSGCHKLFFWNIECFGNWNLFILRGIGIELKLIFVFLFSSFSFSVCSSKDIRNSPKSFNELNGCRVIEGFLMINLIDRSKEHDYDNLTFPALTEITEFFLLYRVTGLKTLAKLFPNLRIIRGNSLISDFSFIIFQMMDLQEIGLKSLTQIARGSVRIEQNPKLCFVNTIDWSKITLNSGAKENVISYNKAPNECATCSSKNNDNGDDASNTALTPSNCFESPESKQKLCWNKQHCQLSKQNTKYKIRNFHFLNEFSSFFFSIPIFSLSIGLRKSYMWFDRSMLWWIMSRLRRW